MGILLVLGCSPKAGDSGKTQTAGSVDSETTQPIEERQMPVEKGPTQEKEVKERVADGPKTPSFTGIFALIDNPFDLYLKYEETLDRETSEGKDATPLKQAYEKRLGELATGISAQTHWRTPEIDLLACDFRHVMENTYNVFLLFMPKAPIEANHRCYLQGFVDSAHTDSLPEQWRERGCMVWSFDPEPPTSEWTVGRPLLIVRSVTADNIPYNIVFRFAGAGKAIPEKGRFDTGWWADPTGNNSEK